MVFRWLPPLVALLALRASLHGAGAPPGPYDSVTVEAAKTSIYIGTVTLSMPPLSRTGGTYATTYVARVFPFFFYNEQGKLWIDFNDDEFQRLERGETVAFTGHAQSDEGEERRIEGHATRADATSGKIKVRVFVSKRIQLIFNTTYRLGKT